MAIKKTFPGQEIAKELRRDSTAAENQAWALLRAKRMGFKLRRQHQVGPFFLDFYCPSLNLAIELDGSCHTQMMLKPKIWNGNSI